MSCHGTSLVSIIFYKIASGLKFSVDSLQVYLMTVKAWVTLGAGAALVHLAGDQTLHVNSVITEICNDLDT